MAKNCILMVAIEDELSKHSHKTYFEHTINSWQYYCDKHNIDFYVIRSKRPDVKYSVWHKEFVFDYVGDSYEKIGVVDFDTMIKWDAPNIFDLYDDEFCGVLDNVSIQWIDKSLKAFRSSFEELSDVPMTLSPYINGGVLFFHKSHKPFFEKLKNFYLTNKDKMDNWSVPGVGKEQSILNLFLVKEGIKRKTLPYCWNTVGMIKKGMLWHNDKLDDKTTFLFKYGYIWHFTGFPIQDRNNLINDVWNNINQFYK